MWCFWRALTGPVCWWREQCRVWLLSDCRRVVRPLGQLDETGGRKRCARRVVGWHDGERLLRSEAFSQRGWSHGNVERDVDWDLDVRWDWDVDRHLHWHWHMYFNWHWHVHWHWHWAIHRHWHLDWNGHGSVNHNRNWMGNQQLLSMVLLPFMCRGSIWHWAIIQAHMGRAWQGREGTRTYRIRWVVK